MKAGDQVCVYPHGSPDQAAAGTIGFYSTNGYVTVIWFRDPPPFAVGRAVLAHPEHGIMFMAMRIELNGGPWGPWVEPYGGGHYEIEEVSNAVS